MTPAQFADLKQMARSSDDMSPDDCETCEAAVEEIERLRAALNGLVDFVCQRIELDTIGMEHDEGCAEDDTCRCECFERCHTTLTAAEKALGK